MLELTVLFQQSSHENLSPQVIMKVGREIQKLAKKPLEGIRYIPLDEDSMAEIHCEIAGPGIFLRDPCHFRACSDLSRQFCSWYALRRWFFQDETSSD
jgi:hypothetical protein